ncbi:hypothetical protein [Echinicola sp. 20G]|uniref:hypothetical protein n=1 Tax=Echinicola sp. 20G TaxID=2781961 RepID=UPI001910D430|nr:hypothetical protein [Echinicola sp. 20G]
MKRALIILIALVLVIYQGMSQDWSEDQSVFESDAEKELLLSQAQPIHLLKALHAKDEVDMKQFEKLTEKLDKRADKKHFVEWFVGEIFYKSHQYVLKNYNRHSTFNETLENGSYDCVSGSAVLGLLLDRYGFDYEIIETDFHVFVLVHDNDKTYVLESTEPRSGFIKDQDEVKDYIAAFVPRKQNQSKRDRSELAGLSDGAGEENTIYSSISLKELAGLQYYNDAVLHFNEGQQETALKQLKKAKGIYPSERVNAFDHYLSQLESENKKLARR